ncbi:MAG: HEAT repeat domain-containing protein, partial [Pirellulaceae bacterium]|nr:HEAT repeat domain-containing protein [Pirellulaceae bacterium]
QRIAILSEQVTRYQEEIETLSRKPGAESVSPRSTPDPRGNPRDGDSSKTPPASGIELSAVTSQLDAAQDAQADLLSENIRLARMLDELADEIALLEEVNQSIQDDTARLRRISIETAAATLSRVEESPIPYLVECLDDDDMDVQIWGASVLGELGPDASDALPALQQMLLVDEESVRMAVAAAIEAIEGE